MKKIRRNRRKKYEPSLASMITGVITMSTGIVTTLAIDAARQAAKAQDPIGS